MMTTMQPVSWREERRRDRVADAQIGRDGEAARAQARLAESEARARLRRDERQARRAESRAARRQRAARRADCMSWLREHVTGLLFVPVIVVPGVLAWTAMAAYGRQVFGPAGVTLPAFSEGAMWAFAGATTITRHRHPGHPVWHLRLGTAVFAAEGAALNFIHGVTPASGQLRGPGAGVVMALISVAGVVAHQLITAGPRRTRTDRASERRVRVVRRAALRGAVASLDADGNARMLFRPGTFALARHHGRARLEAAPSAPVWLPWPMVLPGSAEPAAALLLDVQAAEAMVTYRGWRSAFMEAPPGLVREPRRSVAPVPPPRAIERPAPAPSAPIPAPPPPREERAKTIAACAPKSAPAQRAPARQKPVSDRAAKRAKAEKMLRANPALSRAEVVAATGVSERTADRIRAEIPRRLHVAGG